MPHLAVAEEGGYGLEAAVDWLLRIQWFRQVSPEAAGAHRGPRTVHEVVEGPAPWPGVFEYLEVADRRSVEVHAVAGYARLYRDDVRQWPELRRGGVPQQRGRGRDRGVLPLQAETGEVGDAEVVLQKGRALGGREFHGLAVRQRRAFGGEALG